MCYNECNMKEVGRPAYDDNQYKSWLDEMRPFLVNGSSLHYACDKCGLESQYWTILEKYKLNDWFSKKVDAFRAKVGERINEGAVILLDKIIDKIKNGITLEPLEQKHLEFMASKHRTAQTHFVNRNETADVTGQDVGKILENLEGTDYGEIGQEAQKQVVANEAPVQDQG